jgi:hypothetical protein
MVLLRETTFHKRALKLHEDRFIAAAQSVGITFCNTVVPHAYRSRGWELTEEVDRLLEAMTFLSCSHQSPKYPKHPVSRNWTPKSKPPSNRLAAEVRRVDYHQIAAVPDRVIDTTVACRLRVPSLL